MRSLNSTLPSKRLVLSYVFDWIVIVAIAAVGGGWNLLRPFHRPFTLVDLSISYPYQVHEKIPTWLLVFVGLLVPAIITFFVCFLLVPGRTVNKKTPKSLIWRRKFWEWNTAWMGLALSLATAFMITQGMKNLFGKARPDLISRCQPNLDLVFKDELSTAAASLNRLWVLVTSEVCTQTSKDIMDDGFRSFPSGHASFSWAGLMYLTLFLASKFAVAIPWLPPRPFSTNPAYTAAGSPSNLRNSSILPTHTKSHTDSTLASKLDQDGTIVPIRNQAAAPPVYTLVLVLVPIGGAIYITSTRFTDFRHHGFDLIFGSLIGIVCAWFSFRWYHLPIRQGAGWAWGPRSFQRSWGISVGMGSYVGPEGWKGGVEGPGPANGHGGITDSERQTEQRVAEGANVA